MAATTRGGRAGITDSGNKGKGIGGGGGIPGSGNGGGKGGGGGRPTPEGAGNNLSFPAYFTNGTPETLRKAPDSLDFQFAVPYNPQPITEEDKSYYYFAQGLEENVWQAENREESSFAVDYVDIGDALESAPIRVGAKVRFELSLYESTGEESLRGFWMTLLGGAKGDGKPEPKGPTELQGARLLKNDWENRSDDIIGGDFNTPYLQTIYESQWASVHTLDMHLAVQKISSGAGETDPITDLKWNSSTNSWESGDRMTIEEDLFDDANFGPELNIAGKYILGASEKPFIFTEPGTYLVTFALDKTATVYFGLNDDADIDGMDASKTQIGNFSMPTIEDEGTFTVLSDGPFKIINSVVDTHNGLAYAIFDVQA